MYTYQRILTGDEKMINSTGTQVSLQNAIASTQKAIAAQSQPESDDEAAMAQDAVIDSVIPGGGALLDLLESNSSEQKNQPVIPMGIIDRTPPKPAPSIEPAKEEKKPSSGPSLSPM